MFREKPDMNPTARVGALFWNCMYISLRAKLPSGFMSCFSLFMSSSIRPAVSFTVRRARYLPFPLSYIVAASPGSKTTKAVSFYSKVNIIFPGLYHFSTTPSSEKKITYQLVRFVHTALKDLFRYR